MMLWERALLRDLEMFGIANQGRKYGPQETMSRCLLPMRVMASACKFMCCSYLGTGRTSRASASSLRFSISCSCSLAYRSALIQKVAAEVATSSAKMMARFVADSTELGGLTCTVLWLKSGASRIDPAGQQRFELT